MAKTQVVVAPVLMSKLSVNAPEFYPSSYFSNYTDSYEDGFEDYPTLSEYVKDFLNHLTASRSCKVLVRARFSFMS